MGNTAEVWAGRFGSDYTARNRVDWRARIPFWRDVLDKTGARSVYEVGCNAGWNLSAIRRVAPDASLAACEINEVAAAQARVAGHKSIDPLEARSALGLYSQVAPLFDLVFTAGVLIHVAPRDLLKTMTAIVDASADYVLAVEYASEREEEVEYRGQKGLLWKRPYGVLYQQMGLKLVETGDPGPAFDRCTAWLLRK